MKNEKLSFLIRSHFYVKLIVICRFEIFQLHLKLVQNLSKLYSPLICRNINPLNVILVTVGGYEALYCAILGNIDSYLCRSTPKKSDLHSN